MHAIGHVASALHPMNDAFAFSEHDCFVNRYDGY